jgi:hypothetical protein
MPLLETFANASARGFGAFLPSAAGATFEQIATVAGGSSSITFSSIPQTYTHLQIRYTVRSQRNQGQASLFARMNGVSSLSYNAHYIRGNGSSASAGAWNSSGETGMYIGTQIPAASATANSYLGGTIDILNYTSTSANKTMKFFNGYTNPDGGASQVGLGSGVLFSTSAITSITLYDFDGFAFNSPSRL